MNFQSAASLGYNRQGVPIGTDWRRINFALAGYGYVLPASLSTPEPVAVEYSNTRAVEVTWTLEAE